MFRRGSPSPPRLSQDNSSSCNSTPFVSAPSSPTSHSSHHSSNNYFYSAPSSPMHFTNISKHTSKTTPSHSLIDYTEPSVYLSSDSGSFEFEFSSRFSPTGKTSTISSMTSADELFFNGQIRPMTTKLSSHLQTSLTFYDEDEDDKEEENSMNTRGRRDVKVSKHSHHRKARSMSPFRTPPIDFDEKRTESIIIITTEDEEGKELNETSNETTPSCSASSSRSSSTTSGRNSKKWIFLKDLLNRSKSEGGRSVNSNTNTNNSSNKERFWSSISLKTSSPSLSPSSYRDEKRRGSSGNGKGPVRGKPVNGVWRRKMPAPSAHERHYTAKRAQAEEMKKKTFLPYRQGLLGCLGFSSKGYGAFSGLITKNLNPISSR